MRRRAFLQLATCALVAACTSTDAAVEPVWGKQPCAHCAMVMSDKRFGAQLVNDGSDRHYFDDVGCMVAFMETRKVRTVRTWARDAETGRWLDARSARYVPGATSPMDYGFEARANGGVGWDEMRVAVLAKQRRPS